jgi:hypothetical protein
MWTLFKRQNNCESFQWELESAASERVQETMQAQELLLAMPSESRAHGLACEECRLALEDLLAARKLLRQDSTETVLVGPWFVPRVMAAIASRERELLEKSKTWLLVPKVASRLSWISAAVLLVASAWLYQRPASDAGIQMRAADSSSESLFDNIPPPATQDDVLASLVEKNP